MAIRKLGVLKKDQFDTVFAGLLEGSDGTAGTNLLAPALIYRRASLAQRNAPEARL